MVKHTQTIRLFLSVLGHLTSTILAILSTKLHCHFLQQQQLQALKKNASYESQVLLNKESQLVGEKHRNIQWKELNSTFRSSSFTEKCYWEGMKIGGIWTQQERMHINELELLALKLALETFCKAQEIESLHIQMDNI